MSPSDVAAAVRLASDGMRVGLLHDEASTGRRADCACGCRVRPAARLKAVRQLRLEGTHSVALGELTRETRTTEDASLYHKNLLPVTYVTGDLAGVAESPVYAILQMNRALERIRAAGRATPSRSSTRGSRPTPRGTR